jgi:hypothetical protein
MVRRWRIVCAVMGWLSNLRQSPTFGAPALLVYGEDLRVCRKQGNFVVCGLLQDPFFLFFLLLMMAWAEMDHALPGCYKWLLPAYI